MSFGRLRISWGYSFCTQARKVCGARSRVLFIWYPEMKGLRFVGDALTPQMYCSKTQHIYYRTNMFLFFCEVCTICHSAHWVWNSIQQNLRQSKSGTAKHSPYINQNFYAPGMFVLRHSTWLVTCATPLTTINAVINLQLQNPKQKYLCSLTCSSLSGALFSRNLSPLSCYFPVILRARTSVITSKSLVPSSWIIRSGYHEWRKPGII